MTPLVCTLQNQVRIRSGGSGFGLGRPGRVQRGKSGLEGSVAPLPNRLLTEPPGELRHLLNGVGQGGNQAIFNLRSLGTTPISGKTLSERKGHSRSSGRVPGYSRSSSRSSENNSRNEKSHSRNGIPGLEQYENHNSRSNSRSDSQYFWEPA